jgi:Arc/MetJ-type ribon-helix-helix transcriptional regulator
MIKGNYHLDIPSDPLKICTINVSQDHLDFLDRLATQENYPSRSEFLRDKIDAFLTREAQLNQLLGEETQDCLRIVSLNLPRSKIQQLEQLVQDKRYLSRSEVMRAMVRDCLISLLPKPSPPSPILLDPDPLPIPTTVQVADKTYRIVKKSC